MKWRGRSDAKRETERCIYDAIKRRIQKYDRTFAKDESIGKDRQTRRMRDSNNVDNDDDVSVRVFGGCVRIRMFRSKIRVAQTRSTVVTTRVSKKGKKKEVERGRDKKVGVFLLFSVTKPSPVQGNFLRTRKS